MQMDLRSVHKVGESLSHVNAYQEYRGASILEALVKQDDLSRAYQQVSPWDYPSKIRKGLRNKAVGLWGPALFMERDYSLSSSSPPSFRDSQ